MLRFVLLPLVALIGLAASPLAQAPPDGLVLGGPATQQVHFAAGSNLVSLRVYPSNRALVSLFGVHAGKVIFAKDAAGNTYAPGYGAGALTEWPADEALQIYASVPFSITVSGAEILPTSALALDAGWSAVPMLTDGVRPVSEVFGGFGNALSVVEDGDGRAFPAGPGQTPLVQVEPGRGYRLHLTSNSLLSYGVDRTTVSTVLDAIALEGLEVGQEIEIEGFRVPGDGGAGVLRVTESGCVPDGGTCFVPTEHTQAGPSYTAGSSFGMTGTNIQWETFRLCHSASSAPANPALADGDGCYDALQLHGHGGQNDGLPMLNTATGWVSISISMRSYAKTYDGDASVDHTAQYRYATSDLRLERVVEEALVLEGAATFEYTRPEWWGGRPEMGDATDAVSWAVSSARAHAAQTGTEHYVVLSGMYGYAGVIELQNRTVLKGEQDGVRDGQGLRVLAGAPWHYWAIKSQTASSHSEPLTERDALSGNHGFVAVRHGRTSHEDRVVDIEIDGNLEENAYVFTPGYRSASGTSTYSGGSRVDEMLQNTPHWNGFVASNMSGDNIEGSRTRLTNVHVHDMGGNLLLSNEPVDFGGSSDLLLGNSARNHVAYGIQVSEGSSIDRVEVYGFFWKGGVVAYQGTWRDLAFRDIVHPPQSFTLDPIENLVGHRNEAPGLGSTNPTHYYGEQVRFEDITFDLDDTEFLKGLIVYDRGPLTIQGVTLNQPADRVTRLVSSRNTTSETSQFVLQDVNVVAGGTRNLQVYGTHEAHIRSITSPAGTGSDTYTGAYLLQPVDPGAIYTLYDFLSPQKAKRPVEIKMHPGAGADVFVRNASFVDVDVPLVASNIPTSTAAIAQYRVFWRDVSFDSWEYGDSWTYDAQYLENVTETSTGRTSEDTAVLSNAPLSGSGPRYVDVSTALLHVPLDPSNVTVTGPSAGRFTGWANVGTEHEPVLRLFFTGTSPVSATWQAAVRPIPAEIAFPQ